MTALSDAHLEVRPGTVHALLGENGAGKTTLMRIAFGMVQPDAGTVSIDGRVVRLRSPLDGLARGVGMVHQHFTLIPAMTVAENIALGRVGRFDPHVAAGRAQALGERTGLVVSPSARVRDLPIGAQQRVEILKALARDARVLILDEPTAVLAPSEVDDLLAWIRRFAAAQHTVVLITHKLREALAVADDVTVLRAGRTVLQAPASEVTQGALVDAMIGESAREERHGATSASTPGDVVLRLVDVHVPGERVSLRHASLEVRRGEVVGVAGVEGSGHHELLRALAGRVIPVTGRADVPADVAFIPGDRHRDAVVLDLSLTENAALRGLGTRHGRMDWSAERNRVASALERFDVRATGPEAPMRALSGGNQQKFVLARELDPLPPAIVAENPTRGLDVKATRAVHERLRAAGRAGAAVVVYSNDVDEVLALADRVFVVHAGLVRQVPSNREAVGRAMLGVGS
ncbi:MAG: ATP-binding cassette domain-containing protein [Gemmatimonadaceae bacterium]|nr:ATP-binding cassette domain-containing protein [Gemmatimonadaceae bacterium]